MTKCKLSEDLNSSQVTLVSFCFGEGAGKHGDGNIKSEEGSDGGVAFSDGSRSGSLPNSSSDTKTNKPGTREWIKQKTRTTCTKKMLHKRIPILSWLPQYNQNYAVSDLVAGITVGLTVIPQAIAFSSLVGVPTEVGLYSSFMGCFLYTIFGSCKDTAIGPTAIAALLSQQKTSGLGVDGAVLLCFLTGCIELAMGVLQLGFIIDFISGPVSVGFTSAAAIIIATTQVKDVLGLSRYPGGQFLEVWQQIFEHISEASPWDCLLGLSCMIIILLLRRLKELQLDSTFCQKLIWLISIARNIIVVVIAAVLAYVFEAHGSKPFILTGSIKPGLPSFALPPFDTTIGNETYNFMDMTSKLGSAILVVPLVSILESVSLAKAFSDGKTIDATQEMLALGVCNIASSFVSSFPVTGALARGAVNNASGVKTTFGGIYTGTIVLLALALFTPYLKYIPKASLAAVIITAVVFMVEFHLLKPIWRCKKMELVPAIATFFCCLLLRLEMGIVIGIAINILFILYSTARPSVEVEKVTAEFGREYVKITPDRSLIFPSVEYVRAVVLKAGIKQGSSTIPVVVDARHVQVADFTAAKGMKMLTEDFAKRQQLIIFYNLKAGVMTTLRGVKPKDLVCCRTLDEVHELLKTSNVMVINLRDDVD